MRLFFLFFILMTGLLQAEDKVYFNPISTLNARTIPKGTLSFSKAPLNNLNSIFLVNSLNFGLFSRMEIGTAPFFYLTPEHKLNYLVKLNFWRGDWVDWSLTYGQNIFRTKFSQDGRTERPDLKMDALQLATNIHPPGWKWSLGLSGTSSCGYIDSKDVRMKINSYKCTAETGVDLQYEAWERQWFTLGYGRMRSAGISPYEDIVTGVGGAYTWMRPGKFFSRPSLGYYQDFNGEHFIIANTTFYEM